MKISSVCFTTSRCSGGLQGDTLMSTDGSRVVKTGLVDFIFITAGLFKFFVNSERFSFLKSREKDASLSRLGSFGVVWGGLVETSSDTSEFEGLM